MASSGLRDELDCSICLSPYTDPVSLTCGHNFCRSCIVRVLDAQEAAGAYSCPDCRAEYPQRPALEKNRKLRNVVQRLSAQPEMEETTIFCTYCTKSPVPAVRSCLQCENSLCDDHLTAHNTTMDHILTEPTGSFGNKKCSTHKKVLEYYCPQDAACLCVSCCLVEKHRGHQVELLDEASEKKKKKLSKDLDEINPRKAELQRRVQNLHDHKRNIRKKASEKRKNISNLFMDMKRQLETAEKKTVSEISRQEDKIVSQISHLINELKSEGHELSRKRRHMEEMCRITDPIRLLQESDITVSSHGVNVNPADGLDDSAEELISMSLYRSMRAIVTNVTSELGFQVPDIELDVYTAHRYVAISDNLRTATSTSEELYTIESPGEFLSYPQVLSRCGFLEKHYWEVTWNQIGRCFIGMSYPSIKKEGNRSNIGKNTKSWCMVIYGTSCDAFHNSVPLVLNIITCPKFGVFLDYEAGRLSFYELCDPIRHLHTFTASFTEPLHVIFNVEDGASLTLLS